MKSILERIGKERLYFDGGTGTVLQKRGLLPGEPPEIMNRRDRGAVLALHLEYLAAGADIIKTNTFSVNSLKYSDVEGELAVAVRIAKEAVRLSGRDAYVALDVGPTGRMLKPLGDLDFEDAVEIFKTNMRLAEPLGADLILIETMSDMYEIKAAVLAARECTGLPIFVTCAFGTDGKLLTGASPSAVVAMLEGMGVSAIGVNCSQGPEGMASVVEELIGCSSLPVIVNPNAGLPTVRRGETVYDLSPDEFAASMSRMCEMGASVVGGCCGTTPEYIRLLTEKTAAISYTPPTKKDVTLISSYTHSLRIGDVPRIVGERINPTGKPTLKRALRENDLSYVLSLAIEQEERGAHILDVNVGLPDVDEGRMMTGVITELQSVSDLPLQIDTGRADVMEAAMRVYCGKPLVNSVNGSESSMDAIFPLVKKYGGAVIALTMDESGIPDTAEERVLIAERIAKRAEEYGIDKRELIFDPLALTVASNPDSARVTLEALRELKARGYKCSLGVSNISFGLPERDVVNSAFYTATLFAGLDLAIINPGSDAMMRAYYAYTALSARPEGCADYVAYIEGAAGKGGSESAVSTAELTLASAIEKGLRREARELARTQLLTRDGLDVINNDIIPALNRVGEGFEKRTVYLPGLLMSAEAANAAFSLIRESTESAPCDTHSTLVLATVKGDIHDIGKNIVKLIFESYGYRVMDLGRDVNKERVLEALLDSGAELLGLSALMTTTLGAMEETVALVRERLPRVKIIVGGAVLTGTFARKIGADFYAPDALSAVRYAEGVKK